MIRSESYPSFYANSGIVPDEDEQREHGIKVVHTKFHHTNMTDNGPVWVKKEISLIINQFLDENEGCP